MHTEGEIVICYCIYMIVGTVLTSPYGISWKSMVVFSPSICTDTVVSLPSPEHKNRGVCMRMFDYRNIIDSNINQPLRV